MKGAAIVRAGQEGLTLIELLVVLAVIGLLLAIAPPTMSRARPLVAIKVAAQTMADDLRGARGTAVNTARETAILVDVAAKTYLTQPDQVLHQLPDGALMEFRGPAGQIFGERGVIRFYPDGSSSGGTVRMSLAGAEHRIAVSWLTGKVTFDE